MKNKRKEKNMGNKEIFTCKKSTNIRRSITRICNKSQWGKVSKKSLGASADTSRNKKIRSRTSTGSQEVRYTSAGAPAGVKKAKDA